MIDLRETLDHFWNLLYGAACQVCGTERATEPGGLCETCAAELKPRPVARCPRCAVRLGPHVIVEKRCTHCRTMRFGFRKVAALFSYEGTVRDQVHAAKFNGHVTVARRLVQAFARHLDRERLAPEVDLIVPVPMFWWHRRTRVVDLAGDLAQALSASTGLPCAPRALKQVRPARPQSSLSGAERFRNVADLFAPKRVEGLRKRTVLLVDDILTTGATASACAHTLGKAGVRTVHVAVLARTQPPDGR